MNTTAESNVTSQIGKKTTPSNTRKDDCTKELQV